MRIAQYLSDVAFFTKVPIFQKLLTNKEPTRLRSHAILLPRRAAHLERSP